MPERILVALDGSVLAEGALPLALDLAGRTAGAVRIVRVHVPVLPLAPPSDLGSPYYDPAWDSAARTAEQQYIDGTVRSLQRDTRVPVDAVLLDGTDIARAIERAADEWKATMIITTTHGHGGAALAWLGSVASGVVRLANRPVLVLAERAAGTVPEVRRIVIAHDGTDTADAVVEPAAALARIYGAAVTLIRVVAPPLVGDVWTALSSEGLDRFGVDRSAERAKEELDAIARRLRGTGLAVEATVVVHANPARALIDEIAKAGADVVAMATAGRGLSRLFVGSVADKVLRGGERPTLIRRPPQVGAIE